MHEAVYRITQEALNNVTRHAKAQNAWVELDGEASHARLVIGDDGCGFDPDSVEPGPFRTEVHKGAGGRLGRAALGEERPRRGHGGDGGVVLRGEPVNVYVILMRGINVGGKNKIPMAELKLRLEELGLEGVTPYIQSGNVVARSDLDAASLSARIEDMLPRKFKLDSPIVRVVAIDHGTFKKIVAQAPEEFGMDPSGYRYNVIFFMDSSPAAAMQQIEAREGVDAVWQGDDAVYFRNSVVNASKSRLSRITQQPIYRSITIRNWNTTTKLLELLEGART